MNVNAQDTEPIPVRPDAAPQSTTVSRRRFLRGAAGAVGLGMLGGAGYGISRLTASPAPSGQTLRATGSHFTDALWRFRSRPDLRPPGVRVSGDSAASGYLLLGPGSTADSTQQGPLIVDESGEPVWFAPLHHGSWATNLQVTAYRSEPALSWWEGKVIAPGFGQGEGVIADATYRQVARVRPGHGRQMDLHEFHLTPEGTALFTCYPQTVSVDLSAVGGPTDGTVLESVFQELDLRTGRVLLEWHSLDHIPVNESYKALGDPYDYLHVNSIAVAPDGNLLISARHTWALYKLHRRTGQVMWRLGGKRSDFTMGRGAQFAWQHDARPVSPTAITLFDDGSDGPQTTESASRGVVLTVDEARRSVRLARAYRHPGQRLSASAMGSFQTLPGGRVLIGWGTASHVSEFTADGSLAADVRLPSDLYTYRATRTGWRGRPATRPALAVAGGPGRQRTAYASWNGATDVSHWRVRTGPSQRRLRTIGVARRHGFETAISVPAGHAYVAVSAVDVSGRELGHSRPVRT